MNPDANVFVQRFAVGDITVSKIVDVVEPTSPRFLYVDKNRDDFDPHLDWLQPHFVTEKKLMLLSIHSFVLQTAHHTILVDTCVGNLKQGLAFPQWNGREGDYLRNLAAAGLAPEDIDFVFCTHMHVDHTGWKLDRILGRGHMDFSRHFSLEATQKRLKFRVTGRLVSIRRREVGTG